MAVHRGCRSGRSWSRNTGFTARYAAVQRFVRGLHDVASPEARVVIETRPGEEAQVDYGEGPMVRDAITVGKYRRVRLFLLTLAHSRKAVRLLTEKSSTQIWAQMHEQSFRRLGGATHSVVLDNLGEGVLTPDIYDPAHNPLYRDVLAHYGVVALPCRVRDPDRKGKVESGIHHTQRSAAAACASNQLADAQAYLDRWDERWADTRIHGTTKRQVAAMFADERPHLRALPAEPFRYYTFGDRVVHLDGFVEVALAYSARRLPDGLAAACACSGTTRTSDCSIRRPVSCSANTSRPIQADTACSRRIDHRARRPASPRCSAARTASGPPPARSPTRSTPTNPIVGVRRHPRPVCSLAKKHGVVARRGAPAHCRARGRSARTAP